jgi:hypothetical protein
MGLYLIRRLGTRRKPDYFDHFERRRRAFRKGDEAVARGTPSAYDLEKRHTKNEEDRGRRAFADGWLRIAPALCKRRGRNPKPMLTVLRQFTS